MTVPLSELLLAPPIIILDNVRNAENIGSILRTAYCLGITSVVASSTAWWVLGKKEEEKTPASSA